VKKSKMNPAIENKPLLGSGIYTVPDIARLLGISNQKVRRWLSYWNRWLEKKYNQSYSWQADGSQAVSFRSLVDFNVFYQLADSGIPTKSILQTYEELGDKLQTPYPFANEKTIKDLASDGKMVLIKNKGVYIRLDGSYQTALPFIKDFLKKLEFHNHIASKLWPIGKNKKIVCDPRRQFGQPVIEGTNIFPETVYGLYKGGESKKFIASLYELSPKQVRDAIEFIERAA
jgi:uncharacterized protein (DUF433 family)